MAATCWFGRRIRRQLELLSAGPRKGRGGALTEGAGDNTFGGFLSPDDKSLYYVKNDRTLLEVNLTTLQEREVYRVADDWVGYGTWVANSDCTKLVGI